MPPTRPRDLLLPQTRWVGADWHNMSLADQAWTASLLAGSAKSVGAFVAGGFTKWMWSKRAAALRWRLSDPTTLAIVVAESARVDTGDYSKRTVGSGPATAVALAASSLTHITRSANVRNVRFSEQVFGSQDLERDLIVVGGPKVNKLTRELFGSVDAIGWLRENAQVIQDGRTIIVGDRSWTSVLDTDTGSGSEFSQVVTDYGLVVRFESPFGGGRCVLVSGAHTFGTIAAARFVANNPRALFARRDALWVLETRVIDGNAAKTRVAHSENLKAAKARASRRSIVVLETYCSPGNASKPLEDRLILEPHVVGVLDGVTTKRVGDGPGKLDIAQADVAFPSPGAAAARHIEEAVRSRVPRNAPMSKGELASLVSDALDPTTGMAAVGAFFHLPSGKLWRIGDVTVVIDGTVHRPRRNIQDEAIAAKRAAILVAELERSSNRALAEMRLREDDPGRQAIVADLLEGARSANRRYAVINGGEIPHNLIEEFEIQPGSEVIIASDGFAQVRATLDETLRRHRVLIDSDPLCIRPPLLGTKGVAPDAAGFDDMSYLRFVHHAGPNRPSPAMDRSRSEAIPSGEGPPSAPRLEIG